jgi:hypothetical protein
MSRAFRQITKSKQDAILNVKAVNCLDWCEVCLISHSLAWRDFCRNSWETCSWQGTSLMWLNYIMI